MPGRNQEMALPGPESSWHPVIAISMLNLQDHWYFLLALIGMFVSVFHTVLFPHLLLFECPVHVSDEGIHLAKGFLQPVRTMKMGGL